MLVPERQLWLVPKWGLGCVAGTWGPLCCSAPGRPLAVAVDRPFGRVTGCLPCLGPDPGTLTQIVSWLRGVKVKRVLRTVRETGESLSQI